MLDAIDLVHGMKHKIGFDATQILFIVEGAAAVEDHRPNFLIFFQMGNAFFEGMKTVDQIPIAAGFVGEHPAVVRLVVDKQNAGGFFEHDSIIL
jgi:hypothetical protein